MKLGLVLGAGGTVGISYHAGVLKALQDHAGVTPSDASLVIGTSAGSVAGSYLRSGWTVDDFWQFALGTHPELNDLAPGEEEARRRDLLMPGFRNVCDLNRRLVGSAFVGLRSMARVPLPVVPRIAQRAFPGGLFTMAEGRRRFDDQLPDEWPSERLWLVSVDIVTGQRIVLGKRGAPRIGLRKAVMASCAIPGVYEPVRMGKRVLVDGGVHSTTNLDLAARDGCDLIIGIAPMAFDTARLPSPVQRLVRTIPSQSLASEVEFAREGGADVLMLRPSPGELRIHGFNFMRADGWEAIARAAYDATARQLETPRFRSALAGLGG